MREYLYWFWSRGLISILHDEEGRIACVVAYRFFNDPADFLVDFRHDPDGRIVKVETAVMTNISYLLEVFANGFSAHGKKEFFIWDRRKTDRFKPPRIYRWNEIERMIKLF